MKLPTSPPKCTQNNPDFSHTLCRYSTSIYQHLKSQHYFLVLCGSLQNLSVYSISCNTVQEARLLRTVITPLQTAGINAQFACTTKDATKSI